ncbi:hypothetical protein L1D14_04360 [Vibrio tubiashii]|nr:hypothetical protein [Vibrio tubiashii]MCG9575465.1 hypothetical protein [Vibrio tubiashii]
MNKDQFPTHTLALGESGSFSRFHFKYPRLTALQLSAFRESHIGTSTS